MLARTSKLIHPSGAKLSTPLLVPSFSSKGFKFDEKGNSEVKEIITITSEWLTDTALVSAYDCYYKRVPDEFYSVVELCFVDSGGYETSYEHDLSIASIDVVNPHDWNEKLLVEVYDNLPPIGSYVLVGYDKTGQPIHEQIEHTRELLSKYTVGLRSILLKREKIDEQYIDVKEVIRHVDKLSAFDIVGLTEKELGKSMLERMCRISLVREELDKNGIQVPLHIFGSLDPVTTVLYFLAGAEIFDGLTWLRYSYLNGIATYIHNHGALKIGINQRDDRVRAKTFVDNINHLQDLTFQMREYLLDGNFDKFKYHSDFFKRAYDMLCTELGGIR